MQPGNTYQTEQKDIGLASSYFDRRPESREELTQLIGREIEQEIEPPLKDISYGFAQGLADRLYDLGSQEGFLTRKSALEDFEKRFMARELKRVKGNITQYVRDAFGTEDPSKINNLRKNVYRKIGEHGLSDIVDGARPWKPQVLDGLQYTGKRIEADTVQSTLTSTLAGYKEVLRDNVYDSISTKIQEKAYVLAEKLSPYIPTQASRLDSIMGKTEGITRYTEAKAVFERQVIYDALSAADFDKQKAADYLGDSLRTLNRRIEQLGIDASPQRNDEAEKASQGKVLRMDDFVKQKHGKQEAPVEAVGEIERFQQLVREYNARRDVQRVQKENVLRKKRRPEVQDAQDEDDMLRLAA